MRGAYSGRFVVRVSPSLHQELADAASKERVSLNHLCVGILKEGVQQDKKTKGALYDDLIATLNNRFGDDLMALLLIGSRVSGEATTGSDRDFLVVLSDKTELTRALYRWWDETITSPREEEWNPQFVHLPLSPSEAGSLWFEAALNHENLWTGNRAVHELMEQLRAMISRDEVRRCWSGGHPYWVWRSDEKQVTGS